MVRVVRLQRARVTARLLTSMSGVHIVTPAKHDRNSSAEHLRVCAARTDPEYVIDLPDVTSSARAGLKRQRETAQTTVLTPDSLRYSDNDVPPAPLAYS